MRSMRGINRLAVEKFWCSTCETDRNVADVEVTWRCPECDDLIEVRAVSSDGNEQIVIVRKRASELEQGDLFLMPGQLDGDFYRVLGVSRLKEKLGIGLTGYGQLKIDPDDPVNCRIGGQWSEA